MQEKEQKKGTQDTWNEGCPLQQVYMANWTFVHFVLFPVCQPKARVTVVMRAADRAVLDVPFAATYRGCEVTDIVHY